MYCRKCGKELPDGASFCNSCGSATGERGYQPIVNTAAIQPNLLVFGILSLALNGIAGLILGVIGRSKGKAFTAQGGVLTGSANVGYILCLAGFITSIVSLVASVILLIIYAAFLGPLYYRFIDTIFDELQNALSAGFLI